MPDSTIRRRIWSGYIEDRTAEKPPRGVPVVYYLFIRHDDERPAYVGVSEHFPDRLRHHRGTVSRTSICTYWIAEECRDRAHAEAREAEAIEAHQPGLNVAGR